MKSVKHQMTILFFLCLAIFTNISNGQNENQKTIKEGTRQIHLDFHTSEKITDIGKHFSKKQFQESYYKI